MSLMSSALASGFFTTSTSWEAQHHYKRYLILGLFTWLHWLFIVGHGIFVVVRGLLSLASCGL